MPATASANPNEMRQRHAPYGAVAFLASMARRPAKGPEKSAANALATTARALSSSGVARATFTIVLDHSFLLPFLPPHDRQREQDRTARCSPA